MESTLVQQTTALAGTTLHWAERGSGRPLVLLHGLADSHRTWSRVVEPLAARRRLIAVDLAGHGLSSRPDAPYDLDWHAETIGDLVDALGLDDFDLVGHSYGGGVAQYLLLSHASRVRRLGLVAPGGLGRSVHPGLRMMGLPGAEYVMAPFLGVGTNVALRALGGDAFSPEHRRWQAWANRSPGAARALARTVRGVINLGGQHRHFLDRAHEVGELPPIGVFWGERDPILPLGHAYAAMQSLADASLTTFSDCGHFPQLERADTFARALAGFLDEPELRPARLVAPPRQRPHRRSACSRLAGAARWLATRWRRLWRSPRARQLPAS